MAFSKAKDFAPHLYDQSFWCKTLSHPARILILLHLLENGPSHFKTIKSKIPLDTTTISGHFRYLSESGLIHGYNAHPNTVYELESRICHDLARQLKELSHTIDRLLSEEINAS